MSIVCAFITLHAGSNCFKILCLLNFFLNYDRYFLLEYTWLSPTNQYLAAKFEKWAHICCQLITKSDLIIGINFSIPILEKSLSTYFNGLDDRVRHGLQVTFFTKEINFINTKLLSLTKLQTNTYFIWILAIRICK